MNPTDYIRQGKAVLGIELGSTRIKAVLIGEDHAPIASGDHQWENRLENGIWTYRLSDAWAGMQNAYRQLKADVEKRYGITLTQLGCIGISAMMHGYLPFDRQDTQLADFRTWRNSFTTPAARALTELFRFSIPESWSIAHLYQAMLTGETHVKDIAHLTTLAGYIHWQLTGVKVLGLCEASGMFPIDSAAADYDQAMMDSFDHLAEQAGYPWRLREILPAVASASCDAGCLTAQGALLLDPSGDLQPGCPLCPPEGDAATGMTATHSIAPGTGNVSAGTSTFALIVMEKPLSKAYPEIEMVVTPTGLPVAVVHCNTCTSDINAWAGILKDFCGAAGLNASMNDIYTTLFTAALQGEKDGGGLVNLPLVAGEPVLGLGEGRPLLVRMPEARMTFANFARALLSGAIAGLKVGMGILAREQVPITSLTAHGGYFKTPSVGQKLLAAALNRPVSVMETAGEGGPWGMALLAAYYLYKHKGQTLEEYLNTRVFTSARTSTQWPDPADAAGFDAYTARFIQALEVEKAAVKALK